MKRIVEYLGHAGITPVGVHGHEHSAQQVVALKPQDSVDVALALGRDAFAKMPDADGSLLAGGAWLVMQAVPMLEAEFGSRSSPTPVPPTGRRCVRPTWSRSPGSGSYSKACGEHRASGRWCSPTPDSGMLGPRNARS